MSLESTLFIIMFSVPSKPWWHCLELTKFRNASKGGLVQVFLNLGWGYILINTTWVKISKVKKCIKYT
jgi:hypothetical protein